MAVNMRSFLFFYSTHLLFCLILDMITHLLFCLILDMILLSLLASHPSFMQYPSFSVSSAIWIFVYNLLPYFWFLMLVILPLSLSPFQLFTVCHTTTNRSDDAVIKFWTTNNLLGDKKLLQHFQLLTTELSTSCIFIEINREKLTNLNSTDCHKLSSGSSHDKNYHHPIWPNIWFLFTCSW